MNEKPILFSGEMVRAILDSRKTQTRRVIKPMSKKQAKWLTPELINTVPHGEMLGGGWQMHHPHADTDDLGVYVKYDSPLGWVKCPYGKPGDLLWVRETWASHEYMDDTKPSEFTEGAQMLPVWYRANNQMHNVNQGKWRPSIFMPRWASRITLRVTDVRVERVQDISEADARAEGVLKAGGASLSLYTARHHFSQLWDRINAKRGYGWDVNPWVWVVEFRLVD
jgi:hypothetical protein